MEHAAEHHDRASLVAQKWLGGYQQQRAGCPCSEPAGRVSDEAHRATGLGGPDRGSLGSGEPLGRRLGARIGLPTAKGDRLLTSLDGQRDDGIAIHHSDLWVAVRGKGCERQRPGQQPPPQRRAQGREEDWPDCGRRDCR